MQRVQSFSGRNVNHILPVAVLMFRTQANTIDVPSRLGKGTREHNGPVTTTYDYPNERVLFTGVRDAHPFFHFFEALWILAGRADVAWIQFFLKNIAQFSDDGNIFKGAYGERMRMHFGHDQLFWVATHLQDDKNSRRAVINLHDGACDHMPGKDIPCNLAMDFLVRDNLLHLTVFNRSNDMVWGAYGANVVQFSTIQEVVAGLLDVHVGSYTQVSNSFHVYLDEPSWHKLEAGCDMNIQDPYEYGVAPYPMMAALAARAVDPTIRLSMFDSALYDFMDLTAQVQQHNALLTIDQFDREIYRLVPYFREVAAPMYNSFVSYKNHEHSNAQAWLAQCKAQDWALAATQWLNRRYHNAGAV